MRFLVDFNVGRAVADYLRQAGYDTAFVGDTDPRMNDADILLWAVRERRIVVTMDEVDPGTPCRRFAWSLLHL